MKRFQDLFIIIFLFFFAAVLISPLFSSGFFHVHDDTQVARVHQMAKALKDGMFPARLSMDLGYGYGYPIFNFYAPLAYYTGALFVLLGFDPLTATKIMLGLPIFIAGIAMYFLGKSFYGRAGGIIAAVLAMSAPYVALLIFVRGAVAEYYAYAFIPLVFFGLYRIYQKPRPLFVVITAMSLAAVALSHNLTLLMLSPFLLVSLVIMSILSPPAKRKHVILFSLASVILAVLLSAFYWLPAIFEMTYTNVRSQVGGGADFRDHFVCLPQLWESQWGFGGSVKGCVDGLSFRIGKLHLLLVLLAMPLVFLTKEKKAKAGIVLGITFFVIAIFMISPVSNFLWSLIKPLEFIQYPWRFLSIISLSLSFVGASVVLYANIFKLKHKYNIAFLLLCVLFVISGSVFLYLKLFQPQEIITRSVEEYTNPETIRFETSKISDEYLPEGFFRPEDPAQVRGERVVLLNGQGGDIVVKTVKMQTDEQAFQVSSPEEQQVLLRLAYFPGWKILLNGNEVNFQPSDQGIIVLLPQGDSLLEAKYEGTQLQFFANMLSIVGVCLLLTVIIISVRTRKHG